MGILNVASASDQDGTIRNLLVHPSNIQILCKGLVVGMIQSISPNESRNAAPVQSLGVEGVVTTAVGNYSGGTFTTSHIMIYDQEAMEAFGIVDAGGGIGGLRALPRIKSLYQQRLPLDVRVITYTPTEGQEIIDTYRNCWITSYSKTINIGSATVGLSVGWRYEKIV